jgi:putative hemolysin
MEIVYVLILILINGFFAMSEISLVSARRARLQASIDAGDSNARLAAELGAEPTRFLSTIQIAITGVALLSGIVGERTLAPPLEARLVDLGVDDDLAFYVATGIVVLIVTYFAIVIGELVPKRVGQVHAERVARLVARPVRALSVISAPFVWLLTRSTEIVLRVLRVDASKRIDVTEEEIHAVLAEGSAAGVIEEEEHRMVRNLFRLDDRPITSLMTPRADVVALDIHAGPEEIRARIEHAPHSRYPVVRGSLDTIVGIVSARKLVAAALRGERIDLEKEVQPALFVPERLTGMEILRELRSNRSHHAFVVDEYGIMIGMLTLHDVLEAIAGDFGHDPDFAWAVQRDDGSWLFDGQVPMTELLERLGLAVEPRDDTFQTLSGLILTERGRIPRVGERITWRGWTFEVVDMDGQRIDSVLATRAPSA